MKNDKFPQTWEQAKKDTEIIKIVSLPIGYSKEFITQYNEAARIMAERYEARITELEKALSEIIELADGLDVCEYIETEEFKKALNG